MKKNILLNTDSYKASMFVQYPPGTQTVYSYIESRGGRYDETVFFGLQVFIKDYLTTPITQKDIDEAADLWEAHGEPFNREGWEYILKTHNGYLPVEIKAVPEGTVVPVSNVLATIENTDPTCFWLTTWLETALLRAIWYPTTVSTNSREIKKAIHRYLVETGDVSGLSFKLHDFGARGVSSNESAMLGGMAHLVNFMGTDTIEAVRAARHYYNESIAGFSIPAAEHSTITSWGRENEIDAYRNMIQQFAKHGSMFAVVSDSYDIYNAVSNIWGDELYREVVDSGATVVIRPDSGDPVEVVTEVVERLATEFGSALNEKGYRVLNTVRVIQGDGVNIDSITAILESLKQNGYSADNIAFGMGGALLGAPQRDDQRFAFKCSAIQVNGEWRDVYKDPITDSGKKSKRGKLKLIKDKGKLTTVNTDFSMFEHVEDVLTLAFSNGHLYREQSFSDIRINADIKG